MQNDYALIQMKMRSDKEKKQTVLQNLGGKTGISSQI